MRRSPFTWTLVSLLSCANAWAQSECPRIQTLAQVEDEALAHGPDVALARAAVRGAEADLAVAAERPNPSITVAAGSYNPRLGVGAGPLQNKTIDSSVHIDHPLERGGKRALRQAEAGAGLDAARADFADQRRQSLLSARNAFYDLLMAQQSLAIEDEIAGLQAQSLRALELRLADGDISAADVARLRVEALKSSNDFRQAQAAVAAARVALAYLVSCDADLELEAGGDWPTLEAAAATANEDAQARADVSAAAARARQAEQRLKLAHAQATRDLSIGVDVGNDNGAFSARGDTAAARPVFGVGLTLPLFLYHGYEGEIARADADHTGAQLQLQRVQAQARADLIQARNALSAAADVARRQREEILPQAQTAARSIEYAYARGALPLLDLLDARHTLRQARLDAVQTLKNYAQALAAWRAASERYRPGATNP